MADRTITAANSVFLLGVVGLFAVPQRLEGYSADAAFETESNEPVETQLGVDGRMSAGWLPTLKKQTIMLQADSISADFFDQWNEAQEARREVMFAFGIIKLPALNKSYELLRGALSAYVPIPSARKVLQARTFGVTWNTIIPNPEL